MVAEQFLDDGFFDQRHLIALYQRGLINELPIELGPMPLVDLGRNVDQDLERWNIVDSSTGQLTPEAREQLAGLISYEWALWGIVLLYNERTEIVSKLPDEFVQYGVHYALRGVPRVTFLIGYRNDTFTTATLAAGRLAIANDRIHGSSNPKSVHDAAGAIIAAILDPGKQWQPYPFNEISIPSSCAESLKRYRTDDLDDVVEQTRDGLEVAGLTPATIRALGELLTRDNVALTQVTLTRRTHQGRLTAKNNALGVMFFVGGKTGVVVSYPTRGLDGRQWITYEPATPDGMGRAVAALHKGLDEAPSGEIMRK
jgi:hypothetical protein